MAEVTAMRNNALPYPVYGLPYVVVAPLLDADGDPISPSSPDSEISKNGDTFADCTNEATEIATSSGSVYLSLTGTELTTDVATVQIKSTGAKTTVLVLYPRKLVSIRAGTSASGGVSTSTIVLDASASAVDDFYNGMIVAAVIDSVTEVRMITDYTGSNQTATVTPDWNTAPDNNDTFTVYRPDGVQIQQSNTTAWNGTAVASPHTAGYPVVTVKDGTGTGEIDTTSGGVLVAALANNSVTAAAIANGAIDAATFAAGAIDAAALAADAGTEIGTAVWATAARTLTAATNITSTGGTVPITGGGLVSSDVTAVSTDTTAADTLESWLDANVSGTADSGTTTTMVDSARTESDDDYWNGMLLVFDTGPNAGLGRIISDFVASTDTITVATAFPQAVASGHVYHIEPFATAASSVTAADIADAVFDEATSGHTTAGTFGKAITDILTDTAEIGTAGAGLTNINLPDQTMNITGDITGNLSGSVGSVTGAVGSVTAGVTVTTNNDKTGYRLSSTGVDDVLDEVVEGSVTLRQSVRANNAALAGKVSGGGTTTNTFRDISDTKDRITATVDSNGNRTAITLDLT